MSAHGTLSATLADVLDDAILVELMLTLRQLDCFGHKVLADGAHFLLVVVFDFLAVVADPLHTDLIFGVAHEVI